MISQFEQTAFEIGPVPRHGELLAFGATLGNARDEHQEPFLTGFLENRIKNG